MHAFLLGISTQLLWNGLSHLRQCQRHGWTRGEDRCYSVLTAVGEELSSLLVEAEVCGLSEGEGGTGGLSRIRQVEYSRKPVRGLVSFDAVPADWHLLSGLLPSQ